ncbi:hypothetical protein DYH09_02950 [bacterium CPR1]|nr:hypothetical protein [bacterium CPR1]
MMDRRLGLAGLIIGVLMLFWGCGGERSLSPTGPGDGGGAGVGSALLRVTYAAAAPRADEKTPRQARGEGIPADTAELLVRAFHQDGALLETTSVRRAPGQTSQEIVLDGLRVGEVLFLVTALDGRGGRLAYSLESGTILNGLQASITVDETVDLLGVRVEPSNFQLQLGPGPNDPNQPPSSLQTRHLADFENHPPLDVTFGSSWTSLAPTVVSVDDGTLKGLVTPLNPGTGTLQADFDGRVGTAQFEVLIGTLDPNTPGIPEPPDPNDAPPEPIGPSDPNTPVVLGPDLTFEPGSLQLFPPSPPAGHGFDVQAMVRNLGTQPSPEAFVFFVVDGLVTGTAQLPGVPAGDQRLVQFPNVTPQTPAVFPSVLILDPGNTVVEADETNNEISISLPVQPPDPNEPTPLGPDLSARFGSVQYTPVSPETNGLFDATALIQNSGNQPAGGFSLSVFINGQPIGTTTVSSLAAGTQQLFAFPCQAPDTPGIYTLCFAVDSGGNVTELQESNNLFFSPLTVVVADPNSP